MTPQEAISSEWLTWYSQGGGVETRFFEDAVATLRQLRTGLRIKALKIVSLAGPDGVGSRCAIKTSTLCPLIEVNRPLLLQCGNACF